MKTPASLLTWRWIRPLHIVALTLTLTVLPGYAQYQSVSDARKQEEAAKEDATIKAQNEFIGRRFWVVPNPNAISRLKFMEERDLPVPYAKGFVLTEPMSFTVTGFGKGAYGIQNYAQVRFDDGKVAFLKQRSWYGQEDYKHLFEKEYSGTEDHVDYVEYVLTASPSEIAGVERKTKIKAATAAAAWKSRGGVRVGMTAKQVLGSNWGRPESVNRTTGSYGTHEQWVYGGRNYLYFENGILRSIQN